MLIFRCHSSLRVILMSLQLSYFDWTSRIEWHQYLSVVLATSLTYLVVEDRWRPVDVSQTGWRQEGRPVTQTLLQLPVIEGTFPELNPGSLMCSFGSAPSVEVEREHKTTNLHLMQSLTGELSLVYSWWVTIYMGKLSAVGQPTWLTQPFILTGSNNE